MADRWTTALERFMRHPFPHRFKPLMHPDEGN
jgi:hypothetical protein